MMRRFIIITILFIGLWSCEKERRARNPYLGEVPINLDVTELDMLRYRLQGIGNSAFISQQGLRGIFVTCYGEGRYLAWEAACPNHSLDGCYSRLYSVKTPTEEANYELHDYTYVRCSCCHTVYSLTTGNPFVLGNIAKPYPLLNYNVTVSGTSGKYSLKIRNN